MSNLFSAPAMPLKFYVHLFAECVGWCAILIGAVHLPFWITGTSRRNYTARMLRDDLGPIYPERRRP